MHYVAKMNIKKGSFLKKGSQQLENEVRTKELVSNTLFLDCNSKTITQLNGDTTKILDTTQNSPKIIVFQKLDLKICNISN